MDEISNEQVKSFMKMMMNIRILSLDDIKTDDGEALNIFKFENQGKLHFFLFLDIFFDRYLTVIQNVNRPIE